MPAITQKSHNLHGESSHRYNTRQSELHMDARCLKVVVGEFLAAHPEISMRRLSALAGLCAKYVSSVMAEEQVEVSATKAKKLLATMREIDAPRA